MTKQLERCAKCGATLHPFADKCEACGHPVLEPIRTWQKYVAMGVALAILMALVNWDAVLFGLRAIARAVQALTDGA
ncbi:MAG: hypothetical protein QNJ92_03295 [Alphaproteobacteria bacterium]|nr:hypothetical protein [Alphaproteobacteria bacterium]